jgi:hypothetical protein
MVDEEKDLPVPSELMQLLMELGYVAIGRGLQRQAAAIFNGVTAARPRSELPLVGLAVNGINFGNFLDASKILIEALKINRNSGIAKCFLAIAVKALGGTSHANDLAREVVEECDDPAAKALAESFLAGKDAAEVAAEPAPYPQSAFHF